MNILIVDDNKNNRMILKLLLEDYVDENDNIKFVISEAIDGLEAVDMCEKNKYDLVLMDIMMPNMDGIEATKIIRSRDKKIMIIAVSAVDDIQRQKLILNNGAEDYISKPVNSDIFISRIANYITLVDGRNHEKNSSQWYNLYTKEIFSRHIKFIIDSEDDLSEFWEYYLLDSDQKYDNLSDVVRTVFAVGDAQSRLSIKSEIYIEESEDEIFFTVTNIKDVPKKIIELIIKKNTIKLDYKIISDKLSFKLFKTTQVKEVQTKTAVIDKEPSNDKLSSVSFKKSHDLIVFDYMDEDDLYDLQEYAGKLNSLMLVVGGGNMEDEEIVDIYTYLDKISSILSTYSEIYPISNSLSSLSNDLSNNIEIFVQNSEALGPMCKAFSSDLSSWIDMSFHTGAPSVDFMNDTIVVNCQTISSMLNMDNSSSEEELDDIFDF